MKYHEEKYNNYNKGGYKSNYNKDRNNYYGKKDWNKNNKSSYQKKDDKKESKDKDVYLTLTKDVNSAVLQVSMKTSSPVLAE